MCVRQHRDRQSDFLKMKKKNIAQTETGSKHDGAARKQTNIDETKYDPREWGPEPEADGGNNHTR